MIKLTEEINQTFNSYYLEMGATEGFLKGEIKTLVDKLRDKEEEIKKLKEKYDGLWKIYISESNELKEENKKLKKENFVMKDRLKFGYKGVTREEIERVEEENKKLKEKIKNMEEAEERFFELMKNYVMNKKD